MTHKLTCLVSCYNSGDWIEHRINNLLSSSLGSALQIVCINANSPDERDDLIPQKYPVKYIKLSERVGVYEAWNIAIQDTQSDYIANANTDDVVAPLCYEKLIRVLEESQSDFAYPSWFTTHVPLKQWGDFVDCDPSGRPGRYAGNIDTAGVGHFPLWRRSLHGKVGLFDPNFRALGDADFWARCFYKASAKFTWLEEFLAIYLWRNGENLWNRSINEDEWGRYHANVSKYRGS
jgi:GT2 family glycosyltransferase